MAEWIIDKMPSHKKYVEPFFGGGHVFWQKGTVSENVINDINGNLINMYRVIADEEMVKDLKQKMRDCVYSRELFDEYLKWYNDPNFVFMPKVMRAYIYLYLNKVSFNGEFNHFASRPDASNLYNIESKIDIIHRKLRAGNTVIEKAHFRDILEKYDSPDTLFYLDPPYWVTTQTQGKDYYEKTMNMKEHMELRDAVAKLKGKWLMSYDDVPIIRDAYEECQIVLTPEMHQSSATGSGKTVFKREILIANYEIGKAGTLFE